VVSGADYREDRHMTFYWIYDLPNWLLGLLIIGVLVGGSLAELDQRRMFAVFRGGVTCLIDTQLAAVTR
jgi:hypothetical protein